MPLSLVLRLMVKKRLSFLFLLSIIISNNINSDNFSNNTFNNHGSIGLINTPTARLLDEGSFGVTFYDGTPDQKITFTSSPFDWLEASFFYTNIQGMPYPGYEYQDYKDKGFNIKFLLKEQGRLPAIAVGINDIAGTGFYSSEYIVSSYEYNNFDLHLGFGWGTLNGTNDISNPLGVIDNRFKNRPEDFADLGGQFQPSRYFSDNDISAFFGFSYIFNEKLLFKVERDTTLTTGQIDYAEPQSRLSYGLDYRFSDNFVLGISRERDNYFALRFQYKQDTKKQKPRHKYSEVIVNPKVSKYEKLTRNLRNNGLSVNKVIKKDDKLAIELSQYSHSNLDEIENIIFEAKKSSGVDEEILTNYKIADLTAIQNFNESFEKEGLMIFKKEPRRRFTSSNSFSLRPFLAAREGFFKAALLFENNSEYSINNSLIASSNLKYSIWDNFEDLTIPPRNTFPAQVRSDVKDYLRGFNDGVIIGRLQLDYFVTPKRNNHIMLTAGILEEMFNGYGFEYLYFNPENKYAVGFEIFNVTKRDYKLQFGTLEYKNPSGHINFYHRNYGRIPFDTKISLGEYLAGDRGGTIEFSRSFVNGVQFGVFATFTDVSTEDFGEGSFDKGIYFSIPIFSDLVSYKWRPLTKDPGAKLVRKNNLYDLLVRFRPIN